MNTAAELIERVHDICAEEFDAKTSIFGLELRRSREEGGHLDYILIPDLTEYRKFSGASAAQRLARVPHFFNPPIQRRARLGQGLHDRGEAAVFAEHRLSETDEAALAVHLPLHAKAHSIAHHRVPAGTCWDVSVRGDIWGLDDMEELYVVLNIGRLELEPGARLIVRGNVFVMICQELIVHEPRADYQIGILPTPHSVDYGAGPFDGTAGSAGADGAAGADGRALRTEQTFLGPRCTETLAPEILNGTPGAGGAPGGRGGHGRNGGMCKLADIAIRSLQGRLTLFAQAGDGGNGGDGGPGGAGGDGGDAAPGPWLVGVGKLPDGTPGAGGPGGAGGDGGAAGSGGIASNIYLNVPEAAVARVSAVSRPSVPGLPGRGGPGGRGGHPGRPADSEARAPAGATGRAGAAGRARPAPWIFVNEHPVAGDGIPAAPANIPPQKETTHG